MSNARENAHTQAQLDQIIRHLRINKANEGNNGSAGAAGAGNDGGGGIWRQMEAFGERGETGSGPTEPDTLGKDSSEGLTGRGDAGGPDTTGTRLIIKLQEDASFHESESFSRFRSSLSNGTLRSRSSHASPGTLSGIHRLYLSQE